MIFTLAMAIVHSAFPNAKNLPILDYSIEISPPPEAWIPVRLQISKFTLEENRCLLLYKGKIPIQIESVSSNRKPRVNYHLYNDFVEVGPIDKSCQKIMLQYRAQVGYLHKHGHQGYYREDLVVFSGENLLLIPTIARAESISVQLRFPSKWCAFIPAGPENRSSEGLATILTTDNSWLGLYKVMKNCYAFGRLEKRLEKGKPQQPGFYFLKGTIEPDEREKIVIGTLEIFAYFSRIFQIEFFAYNFLFLPYSENGENIMGGVGAQTMGFTMNPDSIRCWQLLSHRLFHAFFDQTIHLRALYAPPNLWFLEGLAGYFEIKASSILTSGIMIKSDGDPLQHFGKLYRQYLYFLLKDPELFAIAPMNEANITLDGCIEFLHYTQAPLIVVALEKFLTPEPNQPIEASFIRWLQQIDPNLGFDLISSLAHLTEGDMSAFLQRHILDSEMLPLWEQLEPDASLSFAEEPKQIIRQLQTYEYVLWTWFREHPGLFLKKSIVGNGIAALFKEAQRRRLSIASGETETQLQKFFPTLYALLKIHRLRLDVCQIKPDDRFRNARLSASYHMKIWLDFVNSKTSTCTVGY